MQGGRSHPPEADKPGIALSRAIGTGSWSLVKLMMQPQYGADVTGQCLVHGMASEETYGDEGAGEGHEILEVIKMLGDRDESVLWEKDGNGEQPIHHFCQFPLADTSCQEQLIEYLIDTVGEDVVNAPDDHGRRPLQHAYRSLMFDFGGWDVKRATINKLLDRGADDIHVMESLFREVAWLRVESGWSDAEWAERRDEELLGVDVTDMVKLLEKGASVSRAGLDALDVLGWDDQYSLSDMEIGYDACDCIYSHI
mmetsp:Transcript_41433/g.103434  ORF Transcript_41433/g.103434 Transcript_41433/m.103434 type:complete len:254 (-) Transcript_41433:259-1020(-)